ncbi:MAG: YceD family protein [Thiotrichaceae bacterium]
MFNRLPVEVNPFRLVEQRKILVGTIELSRLPRVMELLCLDKNDEVEVCGNVDVVENVDVVKATLNFDRTAMGLPIITGEIEAHLDLSCQRCLSKVAHSVSSSIKVILVITDEQAEQRIQEGYESYLVEDERLFIQDFIEDEILLALPLSVMHEQCDAGRPYIEALPEDEIDWVEEDKQDNPFATLKKLKDLE